MPFEDTYTKTTYIDEDVQPTGTPDLKAANLNNAENQIKALSTALEDATIDLEALETTVGGLGGVFEDQTFITGLKVEWANATQIRIKSGACYVPSAGAIGETTSDTTITPSVGASTWYYVYAQYVGGVLVFDAQATLPTLYRGTAMHRSGDSSRRLIGAFKTKADSTIMKWIKHGDSVMWLENIRVAPLWVAGSTHPTNTFGATSETNIDLSGAVPNHSRAAHLNLINDEATDQLWLGSPDDNFTLADDVNLWSNSHLGGSNVEATVSDIPYFPLSSAQLMSYRWSGSPGGARHMFVRGYVEER